MEATSFGWGGPLQGMLYDQIIARGNLIAKEGKSPEELMYLNGNAPWILLRSAVDEGTSAELAKKYTLAGGTFYSDNNSFQATQGSDPTKEGSSYGLTAKMGFRPKPGIESVEIKTYSTMGCLQEANVHFKVWSLEDLEAIDKLYFKPGFAVLLEWGHSIYLTNDGNIGYMNVSSPISNTLFFEEHHTLDEIENKITGQREKYAGNYEGIIGLITNFSYSFNKNGGYDCSIKVVSKGAILEEMKKPGIQAVTLDAPETEDTDKNDSSEKENRPGTALEAIVQAVSTYNKGLKKCTFLLSDALVAAKAKQVNAVEEIAESIEIHRATIGYNIKTKWYEVFTADKPDSDLFHYVSLKDFLKLCTALQVPYESKYMDKPVIFCPIGNKYPEIDTKFRSFKEHFSLDPAKFLFGNKPDFDGPGAYIPALGGNDKTKFPDVSEKVGSAGRLKPTVENEIGSINKIYICLEYAQSKEIADSQDTLADRNYSWSNWLKSILADLQRSLGNVNSFDLVTVERDGEGKDVYDKAIFAVIDKKFIYNNIEDNRRIPVTGLRSVVEDLQIQSEVSKNLGNQFAIAATGGTSDADEYASMSWRADLTNRHSFGNQLSGKDETSRESGAGIMPIPWRTGQPLTEFDAKTSREFLEEATRIYNAFFSAIPMNKSEQTNFSEISAEKSTILLAAGADIFRMLANFRASVVSKGSEEMPVGMFPCTIGLTMKGLARFVVGEHFKVERGTHLSRYDDWGWIITGVDHKVDKHGWTTNLKTQYFPPTGGGKDTQGTTATTTTTTGSQSPLSPNSMQTENIVQMNTKNQDPCRKSKVEQIITSIPIQPANSYQEAKARDGGSYCARYAGNLAKMFTGKLSKGSDISKVLWGTNAGGDNSVFNNATANLQSYGYETVDSTQGYVSYNTARGKALSWQAQAGDVVHYQSENGNHYHMAFFTGNQWVSNFKQNSAWVYDKYVNENTRWIVKIYRARNVGCPESAGG